MFEHLSQIAVTVVAGALLAIGIGMINVGNRTRKLVTRMDQMDERCHTHGLPYSDIPMRITRLEQIFDQIREFAERGQGYMARVDALETTIAHRIQVGNRGLEEMRSNYSTLMGRIDALDAKMHKHVDTMESKLLSEIRRVNGKVDDIRK